MSRVVLWALLVWNGFVFLLYGWDKYCARRGARRVPERVLLRGAVLGAAGAALGMLLFHHKTRKKKFVLLVPAFLLCDTAGMFLWLCWGR